jgi:hypothetical protein
VKILPKLIVYVAPEGAEIFEAIFLYEVTAKELADSMAQTFGFSVNGS